MECEWRDRLAQEEGQSRAAQWCGFLQAAEAVGRRGVQGAAIRGLGLLHAFVRDKQLILQHFSVHTAMITETRRQSGRAIQVHAMRRVLQVEAQGRAWVASTSHAIHRFLLPTHPTQCFDAGGIAASQDALRGSTPTLNPIDLRSGAPTYDGSRTGSDFRICRVPISGAPRVFHLLRPLKRTRSIYDMEERDAAQVHRPGLTPSDGREQGKRPRWSTEI